MDATQIDAALERFSQGVGAAAEERLTALAPLIEYYAREVGELPGRLMMAASFLGDAQLLPGWAAQAPELRAAIEQAQALAVSVMVRLLDGDTESAGGGCTCGDGGDVTMGMQGYLDDLP